jgi:hypothetical protein
MNRVKLTAIFLFVLVSVLGATQVTNWSTDNMSDHVIYDEMNALMTGHQKFGIVVNTHYPNGPGYMMLPFMKMGVTRYESLRWVPFACSLIALSFLLTSLTRLPLINKSKYLLMSLLLFPFMLPAFVYWQGALHEHSYAMSLCLASIAVALRPSSKFAARVLVISALGFLAAWTGFDFLPAQVLSFAAVILAYDLCVVRREPIAAVRNMTFQTSILFLAMVVGIASHLLQNTLYFDSFPLAWKDILSSAATRAGADTMAAELNPTYYNGVAAKIVELGHKSDPFSAVGIFFRSFVNDWSSIYWVAGFSVTLIVIAVVYIKSCNDSDRIAQFGKTLGQKTSLAYTLLFALILAFFSGIAWTFLMPKHAVIHMHFVPRHMLVAIVAFNFIFIMALEFFFTPANKSFQSTSACVTQSGSDCIDA